MRWVLTCFLTVLAVVVLPQVVAADEGKGPQRPGPEAIFQRLDANDDGKVTALRTYWEADDLKVYPPLEERGA